MKNKQIIILVIVIFLAFVGYKIISSNIQENKEKAVLQERYQLDQLQKNQDMSNQQKITDQLNSCLDDANNVFVKDTAPLLVLALCWGVGDLDNNSYEDCIKNKGEGRKVCQLQQGICTEQINSHLNVIKDKLTNLTYILHSLIEWARDENIQQVSRYQGLHIDMGTRDTLPRYDQGRSKEKS